MLIYKIGNVSQNLVIDQQVLSHFKAYRQKWFWQNESGGQLFAKVTKNKIEILKATGPRRLDRRFPFLYLPHRPSEQSEIDSLFNKGLHYVGDWHTHPQKYPTPSITDKKSFSQIFHQSNHRLSAFVMIIVGIATFPQGLYVALFDGEEFYELNS